MYRIFLDMDGTIAEWQQGKTLHELCKPGYFAVLPPMEHMCSLARMMQGFGYPVFILSAVLSKQAEYDKNIWLDRYLPVPHEYRFFVPYGTSKLSVLKRLSEPGDIMLDDFSANLHEIAESDLDMIPVKVMNGINGTKGSWQGARINAHTLPLDNCHKLFDLWRVFGQQAA